MLIPRTLKRAGLAGGVVTASILAGGLLLLGDDLGSYGWTVASELRGSAKDAVPLEFELARARQLVGEILPELQVKARRRIRRKGGGTA